MSFSELHCIICKYIGYDYGGRAFWSLNSGLFWSFHLIAALKILSVVVCCCYAVIAELFFGGERTAVGCSVCPTS